MTGADHSEYADEVSQPRWKRWFPWAGRRYDTLPELAEQAGIWLVFFAIGYGYGFVRDGLFLMWVLGGLGLVLGLAAQITLITEEIHD